MREIKFRYVCKDVEGNIFTFIVSEDLERAKLNVNTYYGRIKTIEARNQFTGLLDKNGKEIYEGDIVRVPYVDPLGKLHRNIFVEDEGQEFVVKFIDGSFYVCQNEKEKRSLLSNWQERGKKELPFAQSLGLKRQWFQEHKSNILAIN